MNMPALLPGVGKVPVELQPAAVQLAGPGHARCQRGVKQYILPLVVWRLPVPANRCKPRGGMGALEKWSCMPCVIYVMTVGWVQMPYTVWLSTNGIYRLVEYKWHILSGWVQMAYIYRLIEYIYHIPYGWVQIPYTVWLNTNAIYRLVVYKCHIPCSRWKSNSKLSGPCRDSQQRTPFKASITIQL
jgi:hypothetical protein